MKQTELVDPVTPMSATKGRRRRSCVTSHRPTLYWFDQPAQRTGSEYVYSRGTVHTGVSELQFVRCERGFKVCLQHSNWPEQVDPDVFIGHARRRHGYISYWLAAAKLGRSVLGQFSTHVFNPAVHINRYSPRNGSNAETQQYKHKYKQNESSDQVYDNWITLCADV